MKQSKYTIRLLRAAEDDLIDIIGYIALDNPSAAQTMAEKIEKNFENLLSHPFMGKRPKEKELADMEYRYLIMQNYLIFYTVGGSNILIHRILHGAREYLNLL